MAVTKRKKGYYIYFRPFRQDLVGVATDAKSKTEARQIEMALLEGVSYWGLRSSRPYST